MDSVPNLIGDMKNNVERIDNLLSDSTGSIPLEIFSLQSDTAYIARQICDIFKNDPTDDSIYSTQIHRVFVIEFMNALGQLNAVQTQIVKKIARQQLNNQNQNHKSALDDNENEIETLVNKIRRTVRQFQSGFVVRKQVADSMSNDSSKTVLNSKMVIISGLALLVVIGGVIVSRVARR